MNTMSPESIRSEFYYFFLVVVFILAVSNMCLVATNIHPYRHSTVYVMRMTAYFEMYITRLTYSITNMSILATQHIHSHKNSMKKKNVKSMRHLEKTLANLLINMKNKLTL